MVPFGDELRRLRRGAGLSQEGLAQRASLSPEAVSLLERGRRHPRMTTLSLLATALELSEPQRAAFFATTSPAEPSRVAPPVYRDRLIGRTGEVGALRAVVQRPDSRLVTVLGPGGVGKTRIVSAVAEQVFDHFSGAVFWLPVRSLRDPRALVPLLAGAVGAGADSGGDLDELVGLLAEREALLIIDDPEHLSAVCYPVCELLLRRCDHLKIVLVSRHLSGILGEITLPVGPLPVPPLGASAARLAKTAASDLLLTRVGLGRDLTAPERTAVARICQRLDGLPLALELAAARTDVMSLPELADALESGLTLLRPGTGPAGPTLIDSMVEWSYDQLDGPAQRVFARLGVFDGGFGRDAATRIGGAGLSSAEVLDILSRLMSTSLVSRRDDGSAYARFRLLQLVQAYALERLRESGELAVVQRHHAEYYCGLAERAATHLADKDQQRWLAVLDLEVGNIGRAVEWATRHAPELALRISIAVSRWCYLRGRYGLGRRWAEEALAAAPDAPHRLRAAALARAGMLAMLQCDYDPAQDMVSRAQALYLGAGNAAGVAETSSWLGSIARERGDYVHAESLYRTALGLAVTGDDLPGQAAECCHLSFLFWLQGGWSEGERWARRALDLARRTGNPAITSWALVNLGAIACRRGDLASARLLLNQAFTTCEEIAFPEGSAWALNQLGVVSRLRGELKQARGQQLASLEEHRTLGDRWRMASVLDELAAIAVTEGDATAAARLLGFSERVRDEIGAPVPQVEVADRRQTVGATVDSLGPAYEAAVLAGYSAEDPPL
ncbi:MAG: putative Xre family binding protein [Friedmanniella sp.]|nr:putative Xre family binding protein [Friedmanniella sp.]